MQETYTETVYRFVVEYHEELPESHKAEYRINGINPDDLWSLQWSFMELEDAQKQADKEILRHATFCVENGYNVRKTWRVRDLGATQYIQRSVMF